MEELDLSELILQAATAGDAEQLHANVDEFERRLVAAQGLADDIVGLLVELFAEPYDLRGPVDDLSTVLRRQRSLLSSAQKRRLNAALRSSWRPVIFDAAEMEERIREAAAGHSTQRMDCAKEFEDLDLGLDGYPEGSVDVISRLLREPWFRETADALNMLGFLTSTWIFERFSEGEKERLLPALEVAYRESTDWYLCFLISEGLGELYPDERAFAVLRRLMHLPAEMPRSFVPHALEHLVKAAQDPQLKARAEAELRSMENDPSEQVRYEVALSLGRLAFRAAGGAVPPKKRQARPKKESRTGHNVRRPPR